VTHDSPDRASPDLQIKAMQASLELPPERVDVEDLRPILVPSSFTRPEWPGPISLLRGQGLALTWAILQPAQTMLYVSRALASFWEQHQVPWRETAFNNLSASTEPLWTHKFTRESGEPFAVAMQHPDGIGPSRLLLRQALDKAFPLGYEVAAPEMSCAFVLSTTATAEERHRITEAIHHCYVQGTRPLAAGLFAPDELTANASGLTSA
jgi:hypothetical protein